MSSLFPLAFKALARLPLPLLHNLGALAGWLAWLLSPTYRRNFATHIGQAGMTAAKWAAIAEAGKAVLELPKIWLRTQDEVVAAWSRCPAGSWSKAPGRPGAASCS
jgi:KDO2-lipid IV(A) lauroyltransferase